MFPVERIIYKASSDNEFEEYELDYILFGELNMNKSEIEFNKDEVEDIKFVDKQSLDLFRRQNKITPWFELILNDKKDLYFKGTEREKLIKYTLTNCNLPLIHF